MSKKTKTFNGVEFEVVGGMSAINNIAKRFVRAERQGWYDLSYAYKSCSREKWAIWEKWQRLFYDMAHDTNECCSVYVAGAGSSYFSISAKVGNDIYFITPSHNRVIENVAVWH